MERVCFVVIATLLVASGLSKGECPAKNAVLVYTSQCQSKAQFVNGRTTTLGTEISQATEACRNNAYKDGLDCAMTIYDECASTPDVKELMDKLYNFDRLHRAYEYVCSNLNVMLDNRQCIARAEREARPCMEAESSRIQREIKERTLAGDITDDIDTQLPYMCQIQDGFVECLNKAYAHRHCADAVKAMRTNVRTIVLFALCANKYHDDIGELTSSARMSQTPVTTLLAIIVYIIVSLFMKQKFKNCKI